MKLRLLAVALLLAGCSEPPAASTGGALEAASMSGTAAGLPPLANGTAPEPLLLPVDWEDTLVAGAWACTLAPVHECFAQPAGAFGTDLALDGLAASNVTAGQLTLEWTAASAATASLVLDANVFTPDCGDCPFTHLGDVSGPSPLTLTFTGRALAPGEVVNLSVYKQATVASPAAFGDVALEQAFRVTGEVAYVPLPTA